MATRDELIQAIAAIGVIGSIAEGLLDGATGTPFTPAATVDPVETDAELTEVIASFNSLVLSLETAGILA